MTDRDDDRRPDEALEPAEEDAHARRAEKADYLREKLAERAEAEDKAAEGD